MEGLRPFLVLLLALCYFAAVASAEARRGRGKGRIAEEGVAVNESEHGQRKGKMFSLFNVVTFRNDPCASTLSLPGFSDRQRNGTCHTASECEDKNGRAEGNCAAGFGVCCIFIVDDDNGGDVNYNCSYVQNPDYTTATTTAGMYSYTINKCDDDVCFIRLDFEAFTILGTGVTDETVGCGTDFMTVQTNTNELIPQICGQNQGQHMYFGIDQTATIQITIGGDNPSGLWDIKVSQIECQNMMVPPDGCLQYSAGLTGRIETFNFANAMETHLFNQDYSHCIRAEAGFCCVQYQVCSDVNDGSAMTLQQLDAAGNTVNALVDDSCNHRDYIEIEGSSSACNIAPNLAVDNKYCGSFLNNNNIAKSAPVCDCTPPFYVHIHTDSLPDKAGGNTIVDPISRGVCLEYMQIPC